MKCPKPLLFVTLPALIVSLFGLSGCTLPPASADSGRPNDLTGWYRMDNGTIIPVFKRDGTFYSVSHGFEVPLTETADGLVWNLTPSSMTGTTIGRIQDVYYISLYDEQRSAISAIEEGFVSGEKQRLVKINQPFDLPDSTAAAPQTNNDFLGWYEPVWLRGIKIHIQKNNGYSLVTYYNPDLAGKLMSEPPEPLRPITGRLGFEKERENVQITYNDKLKRHELTLRTSGDSVIRMPLARTVPGSENFSKPVNIGIPT